MWDVKITEERCARYSGSVSRRLQTSLRQIATPEGSLVVRCKRGIFCQNCYLTPKRTAKSLQAPLSTFGLNVVLYPLLNAGYVIPKLASATAAEVAFLASGIGLTYTYDSMD